MPADVDVCVVGSGLAGIAAGLAARKAGAKVQVLEAGSRAGGKVQTLDGLERGPHSFNGRYAVFWRLLEELGLGGEAEPLPHRSGTRYLARFGRLHALRPSPLTLLATRALTPGEKLRVLADAVARRPVEPSPGLYDFFARRFGRSFADGPLAAMVSGIWASDPRRLALEGCFPGLGARAAKKRSIVRALLPEDEGGRRGLFRLREGLGAIGAAAQQALPIELDSPVRELGRDARGFRVRARVELTARQVVVATEAPVAAKLLWPLSPKLGAALGRLEYAPLSVVHWEGPKARFRPGFGYLACPSEGLFALGTLFHPPRFSTFVLGAEADDGALGAGVARDVERLGGGEVARLLRVDRWPHAVFQPTPAAVEAQAELPALAGEAGVQLAGSYLGGGAMRDALASGFAAGERALKALQRTPQWSRSLS